MKGTYYLRVQNKLLKGLTKAILVLSLITFSGYVSEAKPNDSESAKIELSQGRRTALQKTVYFKTVINGLNAFLLQAINQKDNFTSFLQHQNNQFNTKFKSVFDRQPTEELNKGFLLHYSSHNSEEFIMNHQRG